MVQDLAYGVANGVLCKPRQSLSPIATTSTRFDEMQTFGLGLDEPPSGVADDGDELLEIRESRLRDDLSKDEERL